MKISKGEVYPTEQEARRGPPLHRATGHGPRAPLITASVEMLHSADTRHGCRRCCDAEDARSHNCILLIIGTAAVICYQSPASRWTLQELVLSFLMIGISVSYNVLGISN